ncbi:Uncharacterized protein OBRU01_08832, partial [Operophtera brumata]
MTKPEWQQFLEFAPHYFNYVASCRQNKLPSLLARILGVFSVGGAGDGVLVLENVWYECGTRTRFDLKGSSRHRLAPPAPSHAQPVLMDENLLNLRWERPLYVRRHAARVLWACMERDTSFLATHGVMDYSLLLALGEHDLVLGVIGEYSATLTKNLGSGQPTVVSPEQYKRRFISAAKKYFLQCPEPWDHEEPGLWPAHRGVARAVRAALHQRGQEVLPAVPGALGPVLRRYPVKNLGSGQPTVVSPEQYKRRFISAAK